MARLALPAAAVVALVGSAPAHADPELALYGDVGGDASKADRGSTTAGFTASHLDLFTSTSAGAWTLLAETMFEATEANELHVEVERLQLGYLVNDHLRVIVGRFHAAFGYYNDAFHHGAYYMVPVDRPAMVEFEDGGGLIPAHGVGVHADGRFELGDGHLRYDLEITNGRGSTPDLVLVNHDTNRAKAGLVRLRYEPGGALDGLVIGANVYADRLDAPAADPITGLAAHGPLRELELGAHAAYTEHGVHAIAEALALRHVDTANGRHTVIAAAFVEGGFAIDRVIPYVRYEWMHARDGDPYFGIAPGTDSHAASVGVKHVTTENVALKLQAGVAIPQAGEESYHVTAQLAFAF